VITRGGGCGASITAPSYRAEEVTPGVFVAAATSRATRSILSFSRERVRSQSIIRSNHTHRVSPAACEVFPYEWSAEIASARSRLAGSPREIALPLGSPRATGLVRAASVKLGLQKFVFSVGDAIESGSLPYLRRSRSHADG